MKLIYDYKSKDLTHFIQVGICNSNKVSTNNAKCIGKHSELLPITDDPLSYARQMVAEYNQKTKEEKFECNISVSFDEKIIKKEDVSSESPTRNITILRRSRFTLISTCPASSVKSSRAKKSLSILMQSTWHCLFFVFLIVKTSSIRNPSFLLSYDGYYAAATIYLILQRTKSSKFNHRDTRLKTAFGY